jgi:hypothetical protein
MGRNLHGESFAHHHPSTPLDWLEYGIDVNAASRQSRCYKPEPRP